MSASAAGAGASSSPVIPADSENKHAADASSSSSSVSSPAAAAASASSSLATGCSSSGGGGGDPVLGGDASVRRLRLLKASPLLFRPDIIWFIPLYAAAVWMVVNGGYIRVDSQSSSSSSSSSLHAADASSSTEAVVSAGAAEVLDEQQWEYSNQALGGFMMGIGIVIIHALTMFLAVWWTPCRVWLRYRHVSSSSSGQEQQQQQQQLSSQASFVWVSPAPHCGQDVIVPLQRLTDTKDKSKSMTYFVAHKIKYIWNEDAGRFTPVPLPLNHRARWYYDHNGVDNQQQEGDDASAADQAKSVSDALDILSGKDDSNASLTSRTQLYGRNVFDIEMPKFSELMQEHATAPFFVFQMLCVLLWLMDDYWYYALLTLVMLVVFEMTVVQRRLKNMKTLREMKLKPHAVYVFRGRKWIQVSSEDLVPKDIISVVRSSRKDVVCPCDVLLLSGTAIVNEAMLTGESVPQLKAALGDSAQPEDVVSAGSGGDFGDFKGHIVFGGTRVIMNQTTKSASDGAEGNAVGDVAALKLGIKRPPNNGCIGFVLRTGFSTSQGKLVRTILFSAARVSVGNAETLAFLGILLLFAIAAAVHVLRAGLADPDRSRYKLILNCIMIITSVVPPELPMELSLAVNNSLIALIKLGVFCTEPFRIPFAGAVDVCCFDKTGTLTSDDFHMLGVAGLAQIKDIQPGQAEGQKAEEQKEEDSKLLPLRLPTHLPPEVQLVIAGCHSLAVIERNLIGDPLEKASFAAINWSCSASGAVHNSSRAASIIRRFGFKSALKRMSTIISIVKAPPSATAPGGVVGEARVVCKGAAEVMRPLFDDTTVPADYEDTYLGWSRKGCRVLALGWRSLGKAADPRQRAELRDMQRSEAERDLKFAGFLVLQCPLKRFSEKVTTELLAASHRVVMITGDHVLTACHVAKELDIAHRPALLLETADDGSLQWNAIDGSFKTPCEAKNILSSGRELSNKYSLCFSGSSIINLQQLGVSKSDFERLLCLVSVFARTTPSQKELVVAALRSQGHVTLMCGDGTNDVGALKQAHVGLALITNNQQESPGSRSTANKKPATSKTKPARSTGSKGPAAGGSLRDRLEALSNETEEDTTPKLGDASVASPFVSKVGSVISSLHIIRQGRCTLVTTMQMYKILALNCLITAYGMSVLYLDGVKYGDTQMTIAGLLVAALFLFVSRSHPLPDLCPERPESSLFSAHTLLSISLQFALHFYCLLTCVAWAKPFAPTDKEHRDPDADFKPNVLNSVVFLISSSMTVSTVAANYQGRPFMYGLRDNKPLFWTVIVSFGLFLALAMEVEPDLNAYFELVPLPNERLRSDLSFLMVVNLFAAFGISKLCARIFRKVSHAEVGPKTKAMLEARKQRQLEEASKRHRRRGGRADRQAPSFSGGKRQNASRPQRRR